MRRNLFKKAKYLLPKTKVITETEYSIRFEVVSTTPHEVLIKYDNYKLVLMCNCTHGGHKPDELCAHKIAALTYLSNNPEIVPDKAIEVIEELPMEDIYD